MKNKELKEELDDLTKIKNFLVKLNFNCNSYPTSQYLIYSKNDKVVMIKNNNILKRRK